MIKTETACIGNVNVSARTYASSKLRYAPDPVLAKVLLWETSFVFKGQAATFGERVNSRIRELVDEFATKVKLANAQ